MSSQQAGPPIRVGFLYIAQDHHLWHSLSVAVALARRRPGLSVEILAASAATLATARGLLAGLGGAPLAWRLLGPAWLRALAGPDHVPPKVPMLVANARLLAGYDAIVAPERTTAILRSLGVRRPRLVYTQHGAGDRGGPFEPRLRRFDLVFAAGDKQRERMLAAGLVAPERCAVVGYPKFDLVDRLDPPLPQPFATPRPVVLYNPHFDRRLGSWPRWGTAILDAFARQDRHNLVFAPHLRLFGGRTPDQVRELAPYLGHPAIHMDLGTTAAAVDMGYTRLADIYLGDVSSQVYEFLRRPRPCLFLNAHGADWRDDESYRHWRFGPVIDDLADLLPQVRAAPARHAAYRAEQVAGFRHTFSVGDDDASTRAADAIADLLGLARVAGGQVAAKPAAGRAIDALYPGRGAAGRV